MHGLHSGIMLTSMVDVPKLLKTLIIANMYGMHSTSVVHRFLKQKIVVKHIRTNLLHKKYALATCLYLKSCMKCIPVVFTTSM